MNVKVTKTTVSVDGDYVINRGEYNVNPIFFQFSEEYTDNLVKKAVFTRESGNPVEMVILNGQCNIPYEVLNEKSFELRVYAYELVDEELVLRYSPTYVRLHTTAGSYIEGAVSPTPITPTEYEQFEAALEEGLAEVANVDIDASKSGTITTVTITNRNGIEKSVEIHDGEKGEQGVQGNPRTKSDKIGQDGVSPTITETQTSTGYDISITDATGTNVISLLNGEDGADGRDGADGTNRSRWLYTSSWHRLLDSSRHNIHGKLLCKLY